MVSIGSAKKTCLDLGVSTTCVFLCHIWSLENLKSMIVSIKVTFAPTLISSIINGMGLGVVGFSNPST